VLDQGLDMGGILDLRPFVVARLHQVDAIFAIFGAFDRDKRLILKSRG
jgi:hypothetical protein